MLCLHTLAEIVTKLGVWSIDIHDPMLTLYIDISVMY